MTLEEHSADWALDQRAPDGVADAYAAHIVAEDADGTYEGLQFGLSHATEWASWSHDNLRECPDCGSPWMLLCGLDWECQYCTATLAGDED
jgi:hypothetical protein